LTKEDANRRKENSSLLLSPAFLNFLKEKNSTHKGHKTEISFLTFFFQGQEEVLQSYGIRHKNVRVKEKSTFLPFLIPKAIKLPLSAPTS
jgi:hypothetical protein